MIKYLIVILLVTFSFSAYAIEHSAVSNIFILDTRDAPRVAMEHSALSNTFTLDTRDSSSISMEHSALSNIFTLDTRQTPRWDVDGNGVVDMDDIMLVVHSFGKPGKGTPVDMNDDGNVNIIDLIIISAHFGEKTSQGAPSLVKMPDETQVDMLRQWIESAQKANDGSEDFRKGISVLKSLLDSIIPAQTALLNNYPNPFNPDTWIPYQLRDDSDVCITIYDANGRIIRNLDLGHKSAGVYVTKDRSAYWDGKNESGEAVASGLYFVVLRAGAYQKTQHIVMIR